MRRWDRFPRRSRAPHDGFGNGKRVNGEGFGIKVGWEEVVSPFGRARLRPSLGRRLGRSLALPNGDSTWENDRAFQGFRLHPGEPAPPSGSAWAVYSEKLVIQTGAAADRLVNPGGQRSI